MKHSDRVRWFERAYEILRAGADRIEPMLPEAPPSVTLTIGFPTKKKSGQHLTVGQCHYECMREHGEGFGGDGIIILHPIQGNDLIAMLATLLHEMIHHSLEPGVGHKKPFQERAKRVGLCKPWTATEPDGTLQNKLRAILLHLERELGYVPTGYYVPSPPPPKKPSSSVRIRCHCEQPRALTVTVKLLEQGALLCGNCQMPFRVLPAVDEPLMG